MLHVCTNCKTQNNVLEHEMSVSAYFKFLCYLQVQTYKITCPGGLCHGSSYRRLSLCMFIF